MGAPERILVLVTSLDRGGIESMIMNYYRKIDRKRWQFDFLVNRSAPQAYEKEIGELGGRVFRMGGMYPWRYLRYKREFLGFLKAHPEFKIIHSHLEERSYWPLKLARRAGIAGRICHAHNVYPFEMFDGKSYFREWFRRGLRRTGVATLNLACSRHAGEWLYGETASYKIVTNAVDFKRLDYSVEARTALRRELKIGVGTRVVGFVGRLVTQKNPEFVLRVFAGLENREEWMLIIVGKDGLIKNLKLLAKELGIEKSVIFAGEVPDIQRYYAVFDVLLMPSLHEGLGMVAVEAGVAGLPVLASDKVPREANVVSNTTFLSLTSPEKWVATTEDAVKKGRLAVHLTKAVGEYDICVAVKKLEKIYENSTY